MNRTGEQILAAVIAFCERGGRAKKTHIMYECDLSFRQLDQYLNGATEGNYLTYNEETGDYAPTGKARLFHRGNKLINRLTSTGKNEITGENKDPYIDSKLIPRIGSTISLLSSINESIEKQISVIGETYIFGKKRRDRNYIMEKVLEVATDGARKTKIMYKSNLSFEQVNRYLYILGLTNMISNVPESPEFKTTPKGELLAQAHIGQRNMWNTGKDKELFLDPGLSAQIEAALSPMLSFEIEEDAYAVSKEGVI